MAVFTHLFNKKVIISRKEIVAGSTYKSAMGTVTAAWCHLQPLSLEKSQTFNGVFGKSFQIWFDPSVVMYEGDKLRDSDTNEIYIVVKGGTTTRSFGSVDYETAIIEKTT